MLTRGENLMKANFSAGFTPDKPILVLHGSGDKVTTYITIYICTYKIFPL